MPVAAASFNLLEPGVLDVLAAVEPARFQYRAEGGAYLDVRALPLDPLDGIDEPKIAAICRIVRGLLFAAVDAAQSGHPGGSSSKAEQLVTLLVSGALKFDAQHPKRAGRDRVVWSAGHCSPLFHALGSVIYDTLRKKGI